MLLGGPLVDGRTGLGRVAGSEILAVPDEILQQIALILGQQEHLGLLDDVTQVGHEMLALAGELLGGTGEEFVGQSAVHRDIDLFVLAGVSPVGPCWHREE